LGRNDPTEHLRGEDGGKEREEEYEEDQVGKILEIAKNGELERALAFICI